MVKSQRVKQLEYQIQYHQEQLQLLYPENHTFTDKYKSYKVSYHINEIERLEEELEREYE